MARQVVGNPFENQIGTVSPTATPVDIYERGVVKRSSFEALANTLSNLEQKAKPILERERQRLAQKEFAEGQRLYEKNRIALGEAVKSGLIEEGESPYLRKGYRASQMNTMAMRYTAELEAALDRQKLYTNNDPARIEKFIAKFQGDFMKSNGMDEFADHEVSEYFGQQANKGNELFRASWREKHVAWQREQNYKAFEAEVAETTINLFRPDMDEEETAVAMSSFKEWLEGRAASANIDGMKNEDVLNTILTGVGLAVEQTGDTSILEVFESTKFGTAAASKSLKVQAKILDIEQRAITLENQRAAREEKQLEKDLEFNRSIARARAEEYYTAEVQTPELKASLEESLRVLMDAPDDATQSLAISMRKDLESFEKAELNGGLDKTAASELRLDRLLRKAKTYEQASEIIRDFAEGGKLTPADVTAKLGLWRTSYDPANDAKFGLDFNTTSTPEGAAVRRIYNIIKGNELDFTSEALIRADQVEYELTKGIRDAVALYQEQNNGNNPSPIKLREIIQNQKTNLITLMTEGGLFEELENLRKASGSGE